MKARGKSGGRLALFQELLTPGPEGGHIVPPVDHLKDEAYAFLTAAADTTGNAVSWAAYEIVSDPVKYNRLTKELGAAFSDLMATLNFMTLEKLPYLVSSALSTLDALLTCSSPGP